MSQRVEWNRTYWERNRYTIAQKRKEKYRQEKGRLVRTYRGGLTPTLQIDKPKTYRDYLKAAGMERYYNPRNFSPTLR